MKSQSSWIFVLLFDPTSPLNVIFTIIIIRASKLPLSFCFQEPLGKLFAGKKFFPLDTNEKALLNRRLKKNWQKKLQFEFIDVLNLGKIDRSQNHSVSTLRHRNYVIEILPVSTWMIDNRLFELFFSFCPFFLLIVFSSFAEEIGQ